MRTNNWANLRNRRITGLLAIGLLLALGACGGTPSASNSSMATTSPTSANGSPSRVNPSPTAPASTSSTTSSSQGTSVATCATAHLSASITMGSGGGAGSSYPYLVLTNTGTSACVTGGYPGVSLSAHGRQIGAAARRDTSTRSTTITLQPKASAHAKLRIVQAGNFSQSACQPTAADAIVVYPPNQTQALTIPSSGYTGCSNADTPVLTVSPLENGNGQNGQ